MNRLNFNNLPDATKFYWFAVDRIKIKICEVGCPHKHKSPSLDNHHCHECFYVEHPELRPKGEVC